MKIKDILIVILLVIIDQIIKIVVFNTIAQTGETIELLNLLEFTYVENYGVAFGMFGGRLLLIGLDIMIIVLVLRLLLSKKYEFAELAKKGYLLILSGGIGNLIDRIFRGYVIDYVDIRKIMEYPIFNFADICVVVGVILVIISVLINTIRSQESANEGV